MLTTREYPFGRPRTLVLGGTGIIGCRVAQRLWDDGHPIRVGSRFSEPRFDWRNRSTWRTALTDVFAVHLSFHPGLSAPGAANAIGSFLRLAADAGVRRVVLLSRRGDVGAERCEAVLRDFPVEWTVLRCAWPFQSFSEGLLVDGVLRGRVSLPVGAEPEPFVDGGDVADVAVAALTEPRHAGRTYELTGPQAMTFGEAVAAVARASRRPIEFEARPVVMHAGGPGIRRTERAGRSPLPQLCATVRSGRNARPAGDVERVLGRRAQTFAAFARHTFSPASRRDRAPRPYQIA